MRMCGRTVRWEMSVCLTRLYSIVQVYKCVARVSQCSDAWKSIKYRYYVQRFRVAAHSVWLSRRAPYVCCPRGQCSWRYSTHRTVSFMKCFFSSRISPLSLPPPSHCRAAAAAAAWLRLFQTFIHSFCFVVPFRLCLFLFFIIIRKQYEMEHDIPPSLALASSI